MCIILPTPSCEYSFVGYGVRLPHRRHDSRSYRHGPEETRIAQEGRAEEEGREAPCVPQAWQQEGRTEAQEEAFQEGLECLYNP